MNLDIQETYLGWTELQHAEGCARPTWTVELREDRAYRASYGSTTVRHECADEDCDHGSSFSRTTVRLTCSSCHAAHVVRGETGDVHHTTTRTTGIGEDPRRTAGLYVWPGEPWFGNEPHQWLVTPDKPRRIRPADVIGEIHQVRGARGGTQYAACAVPDADGQYGGAYGQDRVRWSRVQEGLRSLAAAAKWIAAQHNNGEDCAA
ncbi:hypothetical protein ACJ6WF_21100 [Streptomyces sp. MMS24-I2-30]|uniref:hypothetical protein n=1 Tax=Streptomyces sp. MMS24-I2-30 TaxID=3351564 RepID=UPI003896D54E